MSDNFLHIINQYKSDKESVYNTWFINNEERLKAFRSIRRGVIQVIEDIKNKTFPNDFKGSSLEFVLSCISEQKQVFVGIVSLSGISTLCKFGEKHLVMEKIAKVSNFIC
jgi:type II restriction enzyme